MELYELMKPGKSSDNWKPSRPVLCKYMQNVLVDTSGWIDFFRHSTDESGDNIKALIENEYPYLRQTLSIFTRGLYFMTAPQKILLTILTVSHLLMQV